MRNHTQWGGRATAKAKNGKKTRGFERPRVNGDAAGRRIFPRCGGLETHRVRLGESAACAYRELLQGHTTSYCRVIDRSRGA